jgi:predicted XRE-type DNA-binding protein
MNDDADTHVVRGTANIFADLGYADAETHLLKAGLVTRIQEVISEHKLTQVMAATRMNISQPDVSRLLNGQFRDVSVERLMKMLTRLGCDVDIVVRDHGKRAQAKNTFHLHASPAA